MQTQVCVTLISLKTQNIEASTQHPSLPLPPSHVCAHAHTHTHTQALDYKNKEGSKLGGHFDKLGGPVGGELEIFKQPP